MEAIEGGAEPGHQSLVLAASAPPRPRLDPMPLQAPHFSVGFAVGWTLTSAVLGTITVTWLVGMIATTVFWLAGTGSIISVVAFGLTGLLLGRGWMGMAQTMHGRLRHRDLDDGAALPITFWSLGPGLQRLVRHTRSLQIVARDPELPLSQLDREIFEWLSTMGQLTFEERRFLDSRTLVPSQLREELVDSRYAEDRLGARLGLGRRYGAGHRQRVLALLSRFERVVLEDGGDPFR
ncbi:MAG: hypothetical protein AAF799_17660 [Myxococcota bacterium]